MEKLEVFEVVKPQGIKGELKAKILADDFLSIKKIKKLYLSNGLELSVKGIKDAFSGFAFLSIENINTRNDAELYRGKILYASKDSITKSKTAYFISDLIGLKMIVNGEEFGSILNVEKANVDMIVVKTIQDKKAYVPYLKSLQPQVDLDKKTMTIKGEHLEEIIYYEG